MSVRNWGLALPVLVFALVIACSLPVSSEPAQSRPEEQTGNLPHRINTSCH